MANKKTKPLASSSSISTLKEKVLALLSFIKNKLTKRRIIIILIIVAIIFGVRYWQAKRNESEIDVASVKRGVVKEELILTGEIMADNYAKLSFPTSGKLSWIGTKEGDWVIKGQALASLDKTTLDTAYQMARNNLRKYEATVNRVHDDLKDKESTETYSEIETRVTAEATKDYYYDALRAAQYNLRNATLIAPFEGLITYVAHPYAGVNVFMTNTEIELIDPSTIYLDVSADQSEINDLYLNQKVTIILDSFPEKEYEGEITFIGYTPKAGEVGTVYKIRVNFINLNKDEILRIGMTGDANFILKEKTDILYVPSGFVNTDKDGKYVQLEKANNKVYIETGIEGEETIEISGDISEGDSIFD